MLLRGTPAHLLLAVNQVCIAFLHRSYSLQMSSCAALAKMPISSIGQIRRQSHT